MSDHAPLPAAQALTAWFDACAQAGCPERTPPETVPVAEAVGRVTAEAVWARRSSPAFDSAAMDGIAVRAADTTAAPLTLADFVVVDTGDPLPAGYDAVVMREHVTHSAAGAELATPVPPYQHVRSIGEDISAGELLLPAGHRLRPMDVAAAAAAGHTDLTVRRAPVVVVIPTGDEIRPVGAELKAGDILDTNSIMLAAQARELGCEARATAIVADEVDLLVAAVRAAAAEADLVVMIAGSSAGRGDHTADVVATAGTLTVHGVAVRPGHPVVLGAVDGTPVLGAPGYPVSAALTFDVFAAPLLCALQGIAPPQRPELPALLTRELSSPAGSDDWVRVRLGRVGGELVVTPLPRRAGVLTSLVRADALLVVPAGVTGHSAGDRVTVQLLRGAAEVDRTIVAAGAHDLALDLLAAAVRDTDPSLTLATSSVGSLDGLAALRDGLCHLTGTHLLDPQTGEYTLPFVDRVLGDAHRPGAAVIRLAHREQGLLVAPGNPLGLTGVADLARPGVRFANRQPGSGTRALLDAELQRCGVDGAAVAGYARTERTHLGVAAAVAAGHVDVGLGVRAAALARGLDFVPVTTEPFDLVVRADVVDGPLLAPLWALLADPEFRARVEALGGYDCTQTGTRLR